MHKSFPQALEHIKGEGLLIFVYLIYKFKYLCIYFLNVCVCMWGTKMWVCAMAYIWQSKDILSVWCFPSTV